MSVRKWVRTALVVTLVSLFSVTTACYGSFNLTRSLYKWNGQMRGTKEFPDKWMRELLFLPMMPIYFLAAFGDALIVNSVEFWSGRNPIRMSREGEDGRLLIVQAGETTVRMRLAENSNSASVSYAKAGRVVRSGKIVEANGSYDFVDESGRTLYSAELNDAGGIVIVDGECQLIHTISGEQLAQDTRRLAALETFSN